MEHMARRKVLIHQCYQNCDEYYIVPGDIFINQETTMEHMARLKVLIHQCYQNRDEYYIVPGDIFMLANYCEMQQVHDAFVGAIGTFPVNAEIVASEGVQYLEHLLEEWRTHSNFVRRIGWIFNKMEKSMNVNVHQLCSQRFIDNYMDFGKVVETILGGERINGMLMRSLRRIMIESKVYTNEEDEEKAYESVSMILQDRIVGHILEEVADHGDPSLSVQILNRESSCHSSASETSGILPPEARGIWNRLMIRYQQTGRKLSCQLNKGTANMTLTLGNQTYELCVSTRQMCILMQFNNDDYLSFEQIQKATEIPIAHLRRSLESLISEGQNILSMQDGYFAVNNNFSSIEKMIVFKTAEIVEEDIPNNDHLWKLMPLIAYIMKGKKQLEHEDLKTCLRQVDFVKNLSEMDIRNAIESLIGNGYLERFEGGYRYLP